jgi:chromosome segregation ATPase|tara:strand:- start:1948 stop:2505 length:558 start_codon:yes stop_codon:yes gene_type:complete
MSEAQATVQEPTQDKGQEVTTQSQTTPDTSGQSELLHEVMAKKEKIKGLESKLAEIEAKEEKRRQERMSEDGKKDELIAELQGTINQLSPYKERLETHEANRRQVLLERLPESKQDKFKEHPIDVLEDLAHEYSQPGIKVKVDNQPPGAYGGYTSMAEWAVNDPKGYKAQNRATSGITVGYGPKV